jgi:methylated-DNA-[protein]-cysteine S-methyltransferase
MTMDTCISFVYDSPVGNLTCVFEGKHLVALHFGAVKGAAATDADAFKPFRKELDSYFAGRLKHFRTPIRFTTGTTFEQKVWNALLNIPSGETRSYTWIAGEIGNPKAVRAVGRALGKNPLPIICPCHRIIGSDGSLTGYAGGVRIKKRLLELESR